jgi:hypothetical protein
LIVLAVMSMISSIWAFSITSGADIALVEEDVDGHGARDGDMRHRRKFTQQPA